MEGLRRPLARRGSRACAVCVAETGTGSLHALRSRAGSVPRVGPASRHGQLLRGSDR